MEIPLLKFQKKFIRKAFKPEIRTAVLSAPRGNGKINPGSKIVIDAILNPQNKGLEIVLCAASIEQARHVFNPVRKYLEENHSGEYRFIDAQRSLGITHKWNKTRLRVQSSNGKTAMGLVNVPLVVADEPGAWEVSGGDLMHQAIKGSQGKPNSPLKAIYIGTLAPNGISGTWWYDLVKRGSQGSTYVQFYQVNENDLEKWHKWNTIKKSNPLMSLFRKAEKSFLRKGINQGLMTTRRPILYPIG